MAMTPVDSNLSGSTAASLIDSSDPPIETTPLLPAKACPPSFIEPDEYEKEEKIDPTAYALLPALAIGVFLAAADQTIVISSYGTIGSEMNALDKCSWLATAYMLPLSSLQLLYGTLSTSFGTKPLFLFAYATFGLGCLLCGLAQTMNQLILARAITGLAGGFNTLASIVLSDIIPLRKRGVWQAWRNLVFAAGMGAGSCGGWITDTIGWRWSFILQVPLALLGLLNVCFVYSFSHDLGKESLARKLKRVDFLGAVLIIAAVAALLVGFDYGSATSWTEGPAQAFLILSMALFIAFFYVEIKVAVEPFAPASVLFNRTLAACLASNFFISGCWFGVIYTLPLFWQAVDGSDATQASVRLLPGFSTGVFGSLVAGMVIQRTGRYYNLSVLAHAVMCIGAISLILFTGVFHISRTANLIGLILSSVIAGFGFNIGCTSTLVALMATAAPADQPAALSCIHLFRALGSEVGLALSGAMVQAVLQVAIHNRLDSYDGPHFSLDTVIEEVRKSLSFINDLDPWVQQQVRDSYSSAVQWCMGLCAVLAAGGFMACFWVKEKRILTLHTPEASS